MPGPRGSAMKMKERPENLKGTILRLLGYVTKSKFLIILILILIVVASVAGVAATYTLKDLINEGILPLIGKELTTESLKPFIKYLSIMVIFYVVRVACDSIRTVIMTSVTNHTLNRIRNDLFSKMQKLPLKYFDTHTHGELMSLYTNDVGALRDMIGDGITTCISCIFTVLGIFIMMFKISFTMTVTIILLMFSMVFFTKFIMGKSINNYKEQQEAIAKLNGNIEEMMGGSKVVKVFTHEEIAKEEFEKINERARIASTKANIYAGIMGPVNNNLNHINYTICSILGAWMVILGKIDLGSLVSFLNYTKRISEPLSQLMQRLNSILNAIAGAERIFKAIDTTPEIDEGKTTLVYAEFDENNQLIESTNRTGLWAWKKENDELIKLKGDVKFNNVNFSYVEGKQILKNVSFYAKPGQKIAFVGATGAGKTTITNLLNRFYDIQEGEILYDGINIRDIKKDDLRKSLAMVLQDTHLFTGTIADNIRYGKLDATEDEIIEASKLANADEFITMLPEGYNTMITEDGTNLSQGQRQLLSIARAMVADCPVLILDEATSSIDTRTEKLIEEGMDNLMAGRTVFVIAHRLSTVRNSNAIMVLDKGVIIERGDHEDLIQEKGRYYQLYTGQFELD